VGDVINVPYDKAKPFVEGKSKGKVGDTNPGRGIDGAADCTAEFQADNQRAKRSNIYDVQCVVTLTCRHSVFIGGVFGWHGERYGYPMALLDSLFQSAKDHNVTIPPKFVMCYDVACKFAPHLSAYRRNHPGTLIPGIACALGKLHAKMHNLVCRDC
jgi:hypothetical protein